jgi:tRNA-specific 2-thiouridylase
MVLNNKRVIVAMSGGVDSSVAAALLYHQGYDVIGVTMKVWGFMEVGGKPKHESGCCSLDTIYDAKNVANKLNIPHYTVDFTNAFQNTVITNFIDEYIHGRTPNPCVVCNRKIKWEELLKKADSLDAHYVATGHYAIVGFNAKNGRYYIKSGEDDKKDQSYALWGLSQESLGRTLFPLGKLTKMEVRRLAEKYGLKTAGKPESQEICFVADDNYKRFLREKAPGTIEKISNGEFIYKNEIIGNHKGVPFYTVGQRRGLGISFGKPLYVTDIDAETNRITLGTKEDLFQSELEADDLNFVSISKLEKGQKVITKIRYSDEGSCAEIIDSDEKMIKLRFENSKSAISPGQSVVLYDTEGFLLVGGVIRKKNN